MKKLVCCVAAMAVMLMSSAAAVEVSAESAILLDAESGAVLYEKAADRRRLIASTTKIMTALLVLETCDPEDVVEIPKECEYVEGSSMYLRAGECLTVRELLYGLLLLSGNDAGLALAIHAGGGDPARFVAEMNRFVEKLGLRDTHFENPHGLDGEAHYASARDLARLTIRAMENEEFREIVSTKEIRIAGRA
ncbi:MAG: D-alanyl-D-alanine carboxypeptidase, partial [Ruminococcaceae bacterium]|nr:D-alanyl-D-alanine carboxypeptidase [Oscillospiraceae bacterium]